MSCIQAVPRELRNSDGRYTLMFFSDTSMHFNIRFADQSIDRCMKVKNLIQIQYAIHNRFKNFRKIR